MTLDQIRRVLLETRARLRACMPEWRDAVNDILAVEGALAHPGPLLTDDEVFDEVIRRGGDLLLDVAGQLDTSVLVRLAHERLTEETERSRRAREDLDFPTPLDAPEAL